jgi:hypothetical protein
VEALKALMRFFSYAFHGLLALFLIAVSGLALGTGASQSLHMGMLPWKGATLTYVVFFGALFGLLTLLLALRGVARWLFVLWSLAVLVFLIRGYIFSPYKFEGGHTSTAVYLTLGSLLAVFGAWFQARRMPARAKRYQTGT